jgi:hypothetical protein
MNATARGYQALDDAGVETVERVEIRLVMSRAEADQLAADRIERLPSDLLADQAKPSAQTVADALIAAGYGGTP